MAIEDLDISLTLPNVGPGPDPLRLGDLVAAGAAPDPTTGESEPAHEFVLILLQRDFHCTNCRRQVQAVADRYEEFRERGTEVISIVPEPRERVREWQTTYELPYPLCADPDAEAGEVFDQPVRFGPLGRLSDLLGRMPVAIILDVRNPEQIEIAYSHRGSSTWDRPDVDDLLSVLDRLE